MGRRHARRPDRVRPRQPGQAAAGGRPLQGRRADDTAGRRPTVPVHPPGQHGRHPVQPADPGCRRTRAHQDGLRRDRWVARPPAIDRDRTAQTRHDRGAGQAARSHEPSARRRLAQAPCDDGWLRVGRRLALEDRPVDAVRRVRAVAAGVDTDAPPRAADAVPRDPRPGDGGDGLGYSAREGAALHATRRTLRDLGRRRTLRAHRATGPRVVDDPRLRRHPGHLVHRNTRRGNR